MAVTVFRCKQFVIEHSDCVQKVTTDSMLLGSWCRLDGAKDILDIGTGSGLLALMMAQRSSVDAHIDAVELDAAAAELAQRNVANSPWPDKVTVYCTNVSRYSPCKQYDLIITNPPYFPARQYQLEDAAPSSSRQNAREQTTLTLMSLLALSSDLLRTNGILSAVLPVSGFEFMRQHCVEYSLHLKRFMSVRETEQHTDKLVLFELRKISNEPLNVSQANSTECVNESLSIRAENNAYSHQYRDLCKAFYLNF